MNIEELEDAFSDLRPLFPVGPRSITPEEYRVSQIKRIIRLFQRNEIDRFTLQHQIEGYNSHGPVILSGNKIHLLNSYGYVTETFDL